MIFNELKGAEPTFKEEYFKNMIPRFINASLSIEGASGDYSCENEALDQYFNTKALEYALNPEFEGELDQNIIKDIAYYVTAEAYAGYRKGRADVIGSNVERTPANLIPSQMSALLYDYRKDGEYITDPFLREAKFHIQFLHIHPFGDGNGRTARVLLIKNLCSQGLAPCIITKDVKDEYCQYIENRDIEGLAKLFRERSEKEKRFMVELYKNLNDRGLIEGSKMTEEQANRYRKISNIEIPENMIVEENPEYPLRNMETLIKIFRYSKLARRFELNCSPIHSPALHIYDRIVDEKTGDEAMYCERTKSMMIRLTGSSKFFKVSRVYSEYKYEVDGKELSMEEFMEELEKTIPKKFDSKKAYHK